jgi:hypothetical protein
MTFEQWLQSRLTAHGFPCGAIDGQIGSRTIAALKAFEAHHELPVNGTADQQVIDLLRLSATELTPRIPERDEDAPEPDPAVVALRLNPWPRQKDVGTFYGKVGENQTHIEVPFDMFLAWDKSVRVKRITLHKKVADSALRVFRQVAGTYSEGEIRNLGLHLFGGSLNVRRMRGGSNYSMHSWGIAIDFDPERNQLKWGRDKARLAQEDAEPFWKAWEAESWLSLGRARNYDWMHVQAALL